MAVDGVDARQWLMPNVKMPDVRHSPLDILPFDRYLAGCFSEAAAPEAVFAFASSTSFLIFARRRTTRFRLIWCRDLSPFNLDINRL